MHIGYMSSTMSGRWTYRSFSIVTHKHIALKLVAEGQSALIEGSVVLIMHGLMGLERRRSRGEVQCSDRNFIQAAHYGMQAFL